MNWEGAPNYRWRKTHNKTAYAVTADELGFHDEDRTKEKTRDAANAWWQAKLLSLKPKVRERKSEFDPFPPNKWGEPTFLTGSFPSIFSQLEQRIEDGDPQFAEIVRQITEPAPAGSSVSHWTQSYLNIKRVDGNRGTGRFDNLQRSINKLKKHLGEDQPITALNWSTWDSFITALHATKLEETSKRDVVSDCREFVRFLERRSVIPEVKNISETKIKVGLKKIEYFTKAELRFILKKSTGLLRAFLLLFCNCGFRQGDVATTTVSMIGPKYLTRQRQKSTDTGAPTVSWILWPETLEALKPYRNESGLLLTREGLPWVVEELNENNKRKRDDAFRRILWVDFAKEHNIRLSSEAIRKGCANLLTTDSRTTNQLSIQIKYMGQVPSGVALRHYIDPPQKDLDSAIMKLRKHLLL